MTVGLEVNHIHKPCLLWLENWLIQRTLMRSHFAQSENQEHWREEAFRLRKQEWQQSCITAITGKHLLMGIDVLFDLEVFVSIKFLLQHFPKLFRKDVKTTRNFCLTGVFKSPLHNSEAWFIYNEYVFTFVLQCPGCWFTISKPSHIRHLMWSRSMFRSHFEHFWLIAE